MHHDRPVAVVGDGLAGTAAAAALARAGHVVDLITDPHGAPASRLPLGTLHPHIAAQADPLARVRRHGLRATRAWLRVLERRGFDAGRRADGLLTVPVDARSRRRRDSLPPSGPGPHRIDPRLALEAFGVPITEPAILDPRGACIDPRAFTDALVASAGERIRRFHGRVSALHRDHGWRLEGSPGVLPMHRERVIVATGAGTTGLVPSLTPVIEPARGQATAIAATAASREQRCPVSGDGYVTPALTGRHWVGATLRRGSRDPQPSCDEDRENAARFARLWAHHDAPRTLDSFVGVRATTPDRIPIVGEIAPGLWLSVGHGSHGLCTAPLAGLLLARAMGGRHSPLLRLMALERPALARIRQSTPH